MIYNFIRRGTGNVYGIEFRCDLDARRAAADTKDIVKVETEAGRVVWRRNVDIRTANATLKYPDLRVCEWFAPEQESK